MVYGNQVWILFTLKLFHNLSFYLREFSLWWTCARFFLITCISLILDGRIDITYSLTCDPTLSKFLWPELFFYWQLFDFLQIKNLYVFVWFIIVNCRLIVVFMMTVAAGLNCSLIIVFEMTAAVGLNLGWL
jgi:hypothetical protein